MIIAGYLASIIMGISLGLIGGGGSILTVPILFYLFKQDSVLATTNSLFVVGLTALVGALINVKKGNIDLKTGVLFAIPSFLGVYLTRVFLLPYMPDIIFSAFGLTLTKPLLIMLVFAILMIFASRSMIRAGSIKQIESIDTRNLFSIGRKGFFVGCTTGFVGAGGGFLIIPALVLLLNLPIRIAIGTSLAIIAANSLFGFFISTIKYTIAIDWNLLLSICGLGILGIVIGNIFSSKVSEKKLKQGFGYFVLIIGSLILIDQTLRMI